MTGDSAKRPDRSAAAKVPRDARICTLRAQRKTWTAIANNVGLSERQCRKVWEAYLEDHTRSLVEQGPDVLVAEAMEELDQIANVMAEIMDNAESQCAAVGAARVRADLLMNRIALAQAVGLLPRDLGVIRHVHDVRAMVVEIVAIMRKRKVPVEVQREIQQVVAG